MMMIESTDDMKVCAKYGIICMNFIITVLGVILLGATIDLRSDGGLYEYSKRLPLDNFYTACYLALALGLVLIVIGFAGCLAAAIESPFLLITYSALSAFCLIVEIAICVSVWQKGGGESLQRMMGEKITREMERRNDDHDARRFLDLIQLKLECCGGVNYGDYKKMGQDIPPSCNSDRTNNVHIRSCSENLRRFLDIRGGIIGGVCLSLCMAHIFALLLVLCLFFVLKQDYRSLKLQNRGY